ncbi:LADA_0H10374g1_1 [Lachancea dasiensis]|uniref:Signal recognition particle subunit SRP72 n=1 Tax=Lachancea dasiensis TaxID=1072105 RepID=A0A1G4K334_9SACH|nr:LADA_0H10374g1_1 [Lachancea dasiensis]
MKDLASLFADLDVQYNDNRHSEVVTTCQRLIDGGVEDKTPVLRQWLIALIKSDQYYQSWDLLKRFESDIADDFILERLYVLYKLGYAKEFERLYKKVKTLIHSSGDSQNRGILHVRAQFLIKTGHHDEAAEIYKVLAQNNEQQLDNETEIACNERAAVSSSSFVRDTALVTILNDESYDLLFNESLIALAKDEPKQAIDYLVKAASLADKEGSEEDQFSIELQRSYVLQAIGKVTESQDILRDLQQKSKVGSTNYLLATSNLKSFQDFSKYSTNIPLLSRELNVSKLSGIAGSLGHEQQNRILNNLLFLKLFSNSSIQPKKSIISKTFSQYQALVNDVTLEPYYTQAKKTYHHAMSAIACGTGGSTIGLLLLAVQLQVVEKEWERAVHLCETFLNRCSPALTAEYRIVSCILFELYQESGRTDSVNSLLERLVSGMEDHHIKDDPLFWRLVAFKFLSQACQEKANKIFAKLQVLSPDLPLTNPGFENHDLSIHELESLVDTVDIEAIKSQGATAFEGHGKHSNQFRLGRVVKKRRIHKNKKLPKNYDSTVQPNPERWLPLKDRSDFRPNKKIAAKQTQGGSVGRKGDHNLDISKKSKAKKNRS